MQRPNPAQGVEGDDDRLVAVDELVGPVAADEGAHLVDKLVHGLAHVTGQSMP